MILQAEIAKIMVALAEYYDKTLTPTQIAMYVEDLQDLSPPELVQAVHAYRQNPENTRFPLPAALKALARPTPSDEQNAIDAVSRIIQAVAKFGPYRSMEAESFIGELGWLVVQRDGGWNNICQFLNEENMGQFRAQWREMAKAFSSRSKAGTLETPPSLPKPVSGGFAKLGSLIGKALGHQPKEEK